MNRSTKLRFDTWLVSTPTTNVVEPKTGHSGHLPNASAPTTVTTVRASDDWNVASYFVSTQTTMVVSSSYVNGGSLWHTELGAGYQELGNALVELRDLNEDEPAIEEPVYRAAQFLATALMNCSYPAPRLFNHGPKSVVFNWMNDDRNNLYLTVAADCISALLSSPERITRRVEFSTNALLNGARVVPAIKYAENGAPVVTRDGSFDLLPEPTT